MHICNFNSEICYLHDKGAFASCTCAVILNRHHHLPEVEIHRSDCANRHVPNATDRFPKDTIIFPRSKHIDQCLFHSDRTSRSDVIREKAKNKVCANRNRHVPSATDRFSTGSHLPDVEAH